MIETAKAGAPSGWQNVTASDHYRRDYGPARSSGIDPTTVSGGRRCAFPPYAYYNFGVRFFISALFISAPGPALAQAARKW
jgi:hypothetical protein